MLSVWWRRGPGRVNLGSEDILVLLYLSGGLEWGKDALKVLELRRKCVCVWLSKWTWLLPQLSYQGRVPVPDNFVASSHWHGFSVLTAPRSRTENIRKAIIDFCPCSAEQGQGLINIQSKVSSFRLQSAVYFWPWLAWYSSSAAAERRLLLGRHEDVDRVGMTPSYSSASQARQLFEDVRTKDETPGVRLFEGPPLTTF